MGRHSQFTQEMADDIVERLTNGEPLAAMCRDEGMPGVQTVYDWMAAREDFAVAIARAREHGYDMIAVDALNIADDGGKDIYKNEDGSLRIDKDVVQRSRLRVDTRLKLLAKWDPKRYGERQVLAGDPEAPLVTVSEAQIDARIDELLNRMGRS